MLCLDIYLKKQLIESIVDTLEEPISKAEKEKIAKKELEEREKRLKKQREEHEKKAKHENKKYSGFIRFIFMSYVYLRKSLKHHVKTGIAII